MRSHRIRLAAFFFFFTQEQAYALELHATLLAAVEKRDRVGQFMGWLESQAEFAHKEIARLKEREAFFTRALTHMEGYVSRVIESLPSLQ